MANWIVVAVLFALVDFVLIILLKKQQDISDDTIHEMLMSMEAMSALGKEQRETMKEMADAVNINFSVVLSDIESMKHRISMDTNGREATH